MPAASELEALQTAARLPCKLGPLPGPHWAVPGNGWTYSPARETGLEWGGHDGGTGTIRSLTPKTQGQRVTLDQDPGVVRALPGPVPERGLLQE